jgi:hypothetical protein
MFKGQCPSPSLYYNPAMMVFGLDSLLSVVYVGGYTAVSRFPMALYFGVYAMNCFATLMLWYIYALGWYSIPLSKL